MNENKSSFAKSFPVAFGLISKLFQHNSQGFVVFTERYGASSTSKEKGISR